MKPQTRELIMEDSKQAEAKQPTAPTLADWLELLKQLATEAMEAGELGQASKLMAQASKLQAASKAAELTAKADLVAKVKAELQPMVHELITGQLMELWNLCDGYWISFDKQADLLSFSLFKPTKAARASTNGGASKRYSTTATLLTAYGDLQAEHLATKYSIAVTWQEAFDQRVELAKVHRHGDTKNFLHTDIHKAMLKVAGEIA